MSNSKVSEPLQTNEELRALYDGSTEGILIADVREKRFLRANRMICRMLGYTNEELLSLSVQDIHPPESLTHALEAFKAMSQRRLKVARNVPCLRKDGAVIFADVTGTRLTFQDQPCMIGFFRDITEQKRAMESLWASEERYRLIADNVADVIWTVDFNTPFFEDASASPTSSRPSTPSWTNGGSPMPARPPSDCLDTPPRRSRIFHSRHCTPETLLRVRNGMIEEISPLISHPHEDGRQRSHELEYVAKDGSSLWCEVVSSYVQDVPAFPWASWESPATSPDAGRRKRPCASRKASCAACSRTFPTSCSSWITNSNILSLTASLPQYQPGYRFGGIADSTLSPRSIKHLCRLAVDRRLLFERAS